ncbi:mitotic spindle checkpoint protein [Radiomyces spectabilis]|uniref:mitotic spindle checkpoint protein n=1 Tax=Radiomyces spectabilis TaxID=64574 RepID=UPI00221F34D5|nr:mitotic spindle checkpoint protein [Radiomyces spectabilis]KAI8381326.1 mitotic spindle checkpoint protein [Radiomyces spectabilis]
MSAPISGNNLMLKGTARTITEFFECCVSSILYQRGVYPTTDFVSTRKYGGLSVMRTVNPSARAYLDRSLPQLSEWLSQDKLKNLMVVLRSRDTEEVLERWQFDLKRDAEKDESSESTVPSPSDAVLAEQIRAILRQITASTSFLPAFDVPPTFHIMSYAEDDVQIPSTWEDESPSSILIEGGGQHVRLRSFSTSAYNVSSLIAYRLDRSYEKNMFEDDKDSHNTSATSAKKRPVTKPADDDDNKKLKTH